MPPLQDRVSNSPAVIEQAQEPEDSASSRVRTHDQRATARCWRSPVRSCCSLSCCTSFPTAAWPCAVCRNSLFHRPACLAALFGLRCPGCGFTRSIIHLAEGDWQASWHDHRLGGLLAIRDRIPDPVPAVRPAPARPADLSPFWLSAIGYALVSLLIGQLAFGCGGGPVQVAIMSIRARFASLRGDYGAHAMPGADPVPETEPVARRIAPNEGLRALCDCPLRRNRRPGPSQARAGSLSACPRRKSPLRMRHRRFCTPFLDRSGSSSGVRKNSGERRRCGLR